MTSKGIRLFWRRATPAITWRKVPLPVAIDADTHTDTKRLDEVAVGLIEKHSVGLNDLGDLTAVGRNGIDPFECRSVEVHGYGQRLAGVPKNRQLPAEKPALHQLGE